MLILTYNLQSLRAKAMERINASRGHFRQPCAHFRLVLLLLVPPLVLLLLLLLVAPLVASSIKLELGYIQTLNN